MPEENTPQAFTIEPIQEADLEEATAMRMQSWRDTYVNEALGITAEWLEPHIAEQMSPERIQKRREKGVSGRVARDVHGAIIGVSMPFVETDGTQRVGGLYVDRHWHGSGVASFNQRAKAFYRKWGFEEAPNSTEMFLEKIPTVRMVRRVGE